MRRAALVGAIACVLVASGAGCGETRRSLGEECLRSEDCLSGTCSDRQCVPAPFFVRGENGSPPDEEPGIPRSGPTDAAADVVVDAPVDAPKDATTEGG